MTEGALISIKVDTSAIGKAFDEAAARSEDKRDLFENIGASLVTSTQMRFERETAPDGAPWPPSIRAQVEGGRTLTLSGRLSQSITFNATPDEVEVGSNVIYAAIHQLGGTITPKKAPALAFHIPGVEGLVLAKSVTIPARPYLGLDDDDRAEISALSLDWIAGLLGDAGGAGAEVTA